MSSLAILLCIFLAIPSQTRAGVQDPVASFCATALYKENCKSIVDLAPVKDKNGLIEKGLNLALASISDIGKRFGASQDSTTKKAIEDCTDVYGEATDLIQKSLHALSTGGYSDVNTWISSAMTSSDTCEDSFNETGAKSPISDLNKQFTEYCSSVLAFTNRP